MFLTFKKWTALYLLTLLLLFAGFAAILWQGSAVNASKNLVLEQGPVLVIDPGHGGMDGGAMAADGTVEAQINLAVSLRVEELARFIGVETEMTRREDVSLHDASADTVRAKKASDLKNRTALANAVPGGVVVSIHQNSYPEEYVHGAQVFYYTGSVQGQRLAEHIQGQLVERVDPENKRQVKANDSYYLLKKTGVPIVIVECGFLSNSAEAEKLCTTEYQQRVAWAIHMGILEYLNENEK